ncbi:MAG TPA: hypothetical protein P5123_09185 [Spirochaetota bacterium]|nr:hypothetical protein [Spirochaetota bacterium]
MDNVDLVKKRAEIEISCKNKMKNGLHWFYYIAALSLVNMILHNTQTDGFFVAGLGITVVVDSVFSNMQNARIIGLIVNIFIISVFVLFGKYSIKSNFIILTGIVLYSLDTLIFFAVQDWFSFGFHIIAIFGLITGYKAKKEWESIQKLDDHNSSLKTQ